MLDYVYFMALAYSHAGKHDQALALYEEAHRVASEIWGSSHPQTQRYAIDLANEQAVLGKTDLAIHELIEVRAALASVVPEDSLEALEVDQTLGGCYQLQNKLDDALLVYTRRQHALLAAGRAKTAEMAASWVDLGDVQLRRKDFAAAVASYRRSVAEWENLVGTNDGRLATPLTRVGEAELAAGHPERALEPLERALGILTAMKVEGYLLAATQFPLARALWSQPAARRRARELATSARAAFAASGNMGERKLPDLDRWLAGLSRTDGR